MKYALYATMIGCFVIAGAMDMWSGHTKEGLLAWGFAVLNWMIFFWRPE